MVTHPCVFSDSILQKLAEIIPPNIKILDPMAGTGKLAKIKELGWKGIIVCNDIEPLYHLNSIYPVDDWWGYDAALIPNQDELFDGIVTSPTYGNRMADITMQGQRYNYTKALGKSLHPANTGHMQWGDAYRLKHTMIYANLIYLLKPNGFLILNLSNHIRKGKEIDVIGWHKQLLKSFGFYILNEYQITTKRNRHGANSQLRTEFEMIIVFKFLGEKKNDQ